MKKLIIIFIILLQQILTATAQEQPDIDSLTNLLNSHIEDTARINILNDIAYEYTYDDSTKAINYAKQALELSKKTNYKKGQSNSLRIIGDVYRHSYDYTNAIKYLEEALSIAKEINYNEGVVICLDKIGLLYKDKGDFSKAIEYYDEGIKISKKLNYKDLLSICLSNLGIIYNINGEYEKAIELIQQSLQIDKEAKNEIGISINFNAMGSIYFYQGNYNKAIEFYNKALKLNKKRRDSIATSNILNNIGEIYRIRENYNKAVEYYLKALALDKNTGNKENIAIDYLNIAMCLVKQEKSNEAYEYNKKVLELSEEIEFRIGVGYGTLIEGNIYVLEQKYNIAIDRLKKALEIFEELKEMETITDCLIALGDCYFQAKNYAQAINTGNRALELSKKHGIKKVTEQASEILAKSYAAQKNYQKAYEYYVLFKETHDSLFTIESQKKLNFMETNFEIERKEQEIKLQKTELARQTSEIEKHKTRQNALIGGIATVVVIIIVVVIGYIRIRKARDKIGKQKKQIETTNRELSTTLEIVSSQKKEIEIKNEHITKSITYARRIQTAILPTSEMASEIFPKHFILYKPRNIVSGDFYWIRKVDRYILVAAADCTGHGVPGAFMSMLGVSFLNEIVRKEKVTKASQVLEELRNKVKSTLGQTGKEGETKDGMDIAFCVIDTYTYKLQFSGAYNPLYIIRNKNIPDIENLSELKSVTLENDNYRLIHIKANSQPIGVYIKEKPFENNQIQLQKGDKLYIFSDGYIDQTGGVSGEKFLTKNFKELLLKLNTKPMEEQGEILNQTIENWKNNQGQVDDILVIGIQI